MKKHHLLALVILGVFASVAKAQTNMPSGTIDAGLVKRTDQRAAAGKRSNNTLGFAVRPAAVRAVLFY